MSSAIPEKEARLFAVKEKCLAIKLSRMGIRPYCIDSYIIRLVTRHVLQEWRLINLRW
jgi:hypothetical protein